MRMNIGRNMTLTVLGVLASCLGVTACGDSQGTEAEARAVAEGYVAAFAKGDLKTACTYVAPESVLKTGSCEDQLKVGQFFGVSSHYQGAKVTSVEVLEGSTNVKLDPKGQIQLLNVDGEWKVNLAGY